MIDERKTTHTVCISRRRSGASRTETKWTSKSHDVFDMSPRFKSLVKKQRRVLAHEMILTQFDKHKKSNGKRATSADQ